MGEVTEMKMKKLTRRKFIALASMGIAGTYLTLDSKMLQAMMGSGGGGMGGGGGGCCGGGTTIIDPPPGAPFYDIKEAKIIKDAAGNDVYEITAMQATVNVNGTNATLLTYNGTYPGPLIRANSGDTLRIRLINALPANAGTNILGHKRNITNLHTHGLHVSPEEPADAMMVALNPGQSPLASYNYVYDLSKEEPGHLNFYHPHIHGSVAEQYWAGLAGPLVINDQAGLSVGDFENHVMVIKDLTLSGSLPQAYTSTSDFMRGKEGNLVMVNGLVNPVLSIRPGQVQRWQIVNACNARFLKLSLEKHNLWLIGTDGGLLDKPYKLTSPMVLAPGERIDVLVQASQTGGTFKFLSLPYDRGGGTVQQVTLLTLAVSGTSAFDAIPRDVKIGAKRLVMNTSSLTKRQMTLSMRMGKGYINGISFTSMENSYKIMSSLDDYEVWEISNMSGMDHPFHQHVNSCQVLSITGGDSAYSSLYTSIPAWKDVVIVPKMGKITILVPVMDWEGMTMFHCHIVEHEDIGMMGVWDIMMM